MVSNRKRNRRIRTWDRWLDRCERLAGQFAPRTTHDHKPVFKPTPGYWRSEGIDFFAVWKGWKVRGVDPCRIMPTRHCPALYDALCGVDPCARYESDDEEPWRPELVRVSGDRRTARTARLSEATTAAVAWPPLT